MVKNQEERKAEVGIQPIEPIPFRKRREEGSLDEPKPYSILREELKTRTDRAYAVEMAKAEKDARTQRIEAEYELISIKAQIRRNLKAQEAKLKAEAKRAFLYGRLILIEQTCENLGILEHYKERLESARKEEDSKKLNRKLTQLEKEIATIEEEALIKQKLPQNLRKFFEALERVAYSTTHRSLSYERMNLTVYGEVIHYPWEEGSNEYEEWIREEPCGPDPWFDDE